MCMIMEGASHLAPSTFKCPKHAPFEHEMLLIFLSHLDINFPQDAASFAYMAVTFHSVPHLGEFTVPVIKRLNAHLHITQANISHSTNHNNLNIVSFNIPCTKCMLLGESTHITPISHITNPVEWLQNHFHINNPSHNNHLFAWWYQKGTHPLTKLEVTLCIKEIVLQHSLPDLKGHSLRIRGTLHYLLQGTPFKVIKMMGHWLGELFTPTSGSTP